MAEAMAYAATAPPDCHRILAKLHPIFTTYPHGNGVAPRPFEEAKPKPRFFLSALVVMHNEVDGIREFVLHYLEEGVEHFYIIDDRSSDGTVQLLSTCLQPRRYSITRLGKGTRDPTKTALLTSFLPLLQQETEWVIVVDVDEFMISRAYPSKPIRTLLNDSNIFEGCNVINVPWLLFSWGNFTKSPWDVRHALLWRWSLDKCSADGKGSEKWRDVCNKPAQKAIFRPNAATGITIHRPILGSRSGEQVCFGMGRKQRMVFEEAVEDLALAIHHYRIKSFDDLRRKQDKSSNQRGPYLNVPLERMNRLDKYDDYMLKRKAIREGTALHLAARAELANRDCDGR